MKIIGHHTCALEGQAEDITAPFLSTHDENNPEQYKFLGTGYYFWDNNLNMAHSHGQKNYKRKYYIFEAELQLSGDIFLDLVGNRIDIIHFQTLMKILKDNASPEMKAQIEKWSLAQYIEFFKKQPYFSYRAIRAVDVSMDKNTMKFVSERENFTNLSPVFIICLKDTEPDLLISFQHIKTSR